MITNKTFIFVKYSENSIYPIIDTHIYTSIYTYVYLQLSEYLYVNETI